MKLVFWQNLISPHQFPYIKELVAHPSVDEVVLVVEELMTDSRLSMGWHADPGEVRKAGITLYISPSNEIIEDLLIPNTHETHHFFSGIRAFPFVFFAFKKSLKYPLNRYLIVEGPFVYKKPIIFHFIKTLVFEKKYFKSIKKIFAIGRPARRWYLLWGFKQHQIVSFTYCVEPPFFQELSPIGSPRLLFVGSVIRLKGLDLLVNALKKQKKEFRLDIIGEGNNYFNILALVEKNQLKDEIFFLMSKSNRDISMLYKEYDILVLPSRYDGWGAVVNEALMAGLFIICSNRCGAEELIINKFNGIVFNPSQPNSLEEAISYVIDNISAIRSARCAIKDWSEKISGEKIASYFVDSITQNEENQSRHFLD